MYLKWFARRWDARECGCGFRVEVWALAGWSAASRQQADGWSVKECWTEGPCIEWRRVGLPALAWETGWWRRTTAASATTPTAAKKRLLRRRSTAKKPAAKKPAAKSTAKTTTTTAATEDDATQGHVPKHTAVKPPTARSIKLTSAFLASTQLRPMAQQLAATRSAAAYAGVLSYAQGHPGEGAAAAYLALGHAYTLDHRYAEAAADFSQAKRAGDALDDYADYLGAQAAIQAGRAAEAYALLDHFADHYPDSIFVPTAPVLLANAHLQQNDAQGALRVLEPLVNTSGGRRRRTFATRWGGLISWPAIRRMRRRSTGSLYVTQPLTYEATQAAAQLQAMGTAAERGGAEDACGRAVQREAIRRGERGVQRHRRRTIRN